MISLKFESETLLDGKLNSDLAHEIWLSVWDAVLPESVHVVMSAEHFALVRSEYRGRMDQCGLEDAKRGLFAVTTDREQQLKFCVSRISSGEVHIYTEEEWNDV